MRSALRTLIKHLLCISLYYTGVVKLYSWFRTRVLKRVDFTILTYHRILPAMGDCEDRPQPAMVTTASTFQHQIEHCIRHYTVVSLETLVEHLKNAERPSRSYVVITFDDGWKDNYQYAFPILHSFSAPATIFLTTDYIESDRMFWFHTVNVLLRSHQFRSSTIAEALESCPELTPEKRQDIVAAAHHPDEFIEQLKELDPTAIQKVVQALGEQRSGPENMLTGRELLLNWAEIKEMHEHGIAFGSHTCSHAILTRITSAQQEEELRRSKQVIEKKIGAAISTFAYPNNDYNEQLKERVREAGYQCACVGSQTQDSSTQVDLYALPRLGMHEGTCRGIGGSYSRAIFACYVSGLFRGHNK